MADEMKGKISAYTEAMRSMGELIGTDEVANARKFMEVQAGMSRQWDVLKFKIEAAATPIVMTWLSDLSNWFAKNREEVTAFGEAAAHSLAVVVDWIGRAAAWPQTRANSFRVPRLDRRAWNPTRKRNRCRS